MEKPVCTAKSVEAHWTTISEGAAPTMWRSSGPTGRPSKRLRAEGILPVAGKPTGLFSSVLVICKLRLYCNAVKAVSKEVGPWGEPGTTLNRENCEARDKWRRDWLLS